MLRFIAFILAFIIFLPTTLAQEADIFTYQKLKNVTRGDHPAGTNTTVGFVGDRVHYLILIHNTSEAPQDLTVQNYLPRELSYLPGTAKVYGGLGGGWVDIPGNNTFVLADHNLSLAPDAWAYLTFRTDIAWLPESNVALMNVADILVDGEKQTSSATKILAPNTQLTGIVAGTGSTPDDIAAPSEYELQLLAEEFAFITQAWDELGVEEERPPLPAVERGGLPLLTMVLSTVFFTALFYAFWRRTHSRW